MSSFCVIKFYYFAITMVGQYITEVMFNNMGPGQIIFNNIVINHYIITLEKKVPCHHSVLLSSIIFVIIVEWQ